MPTLTVTTTKEVTIKPALRTKLMKELRAYGALKIQLKAIEHALDKHKTVIGELRAETDEQSISLEGYTVTLVAPIRKQFNPKKFVANGGDLAIYNQSIDEVPSRAYEKITVPGSRDDE